MCIRKAPPAPDVDTDDAAASSDVSAVPPPPAVAAEAAGSSRAPGSPSSVVIGPPPIPFLSLLWLALCTVLVTKQNELVLVFFSFVGSFAAASILSVGRRRGEDGTEQRRGGAKLQLRTGQLQQRKRLGLENATTKRLVGLLSCVTSLLILCCMGDDNDERLTCLSMEGAGVSSEFAALSVVTGYLAFDLWYSHVCHPPPSRRMWEVWEDALTLTAFSVVLARDNNVGAGAGVHRFRSEIVLWVVYKCIRLVLALSCGRVRSVCDDGEIIQENREDVTPRKGKACVAPAAAQHQKQPQQEQQPVTRPAVVDPSDLWTVHGRRYDLRAFVDRHPGGREAIELGRERDCTAMFESYHPFTDAHRIALKKYAYANNDDENDAASMSSRVGLTAKKRQRQKLREEGDADDDSSAVLDPFYETLKERAAQALRQHGIDPNSDRCATSGRAAYYVFILGCLVVSGSYHVKGNVLGSFLFAVFGWLIGALGHDGGHFAVSRIPLINDISVWGISLLCNPVMWQHQHTYAHHSHTNEFDHDPDLHHFTVFLKVHRRFRHERIYGLQSNPLFVFFAYAFVVFGTCVKIPLGMIKTGTLYEMVEWTDRGRPLRALAMLAHYVLYIGAVLLSPLFLSDRPWYVALLASTVHVSTSGLLFAIFSQINHLNERSIEVEDGRGDCCNLLDKSWAARQVVTSNNFATSSVLWHVLSNGLNLQIEHHLFPGLNHVHLHVLAPTVRATCEEFGVAYKSYESWSELMGATLRWLDALSVDEGEEKEKKEEEAVGNVAATGANATGGSRRISSR